MESTLNSNNCRFICLTGIDGSGKTTLALSVVEALSQQGMDFRYVHGLMEARLSKPFMLAGRHLFARGKSRELDYASFAAAKRGSLSKYPALSFAYQALTSLDYFLQISWKIALPLSLDRSIVSDRYVYDTVVNKGLNLGYDVNRVVEDIGAWFQFLPIPDATFLVDVPANVAFSRKHDIPHIDYLRERRGLYKDVALALNMTILDGMRPIGELTNQVVETICLKGRPA